MSSAKKQTSMEKFLKGKRIAKNMDSGKPSSKKLKAGKSKKAKDDIEEEKKEFPPKTKAKSKPLSDVDSNPLNSYEDFVGHLGDWQEPLAAYLKTPSFKKIFAFVQKEYSSTKCFPPKELIFNAFKKVPFSKLKAVIVGQDPYIKDNEATGLCFSVPKETRCPPSLKNIYKALKKDKKVDFKEPKPVHGDLEKWADQGVLMLNASLTVQAGKSNSHAKCGWLGKTSFVQTQDSFWI